MEDIKNMSGCVAVIGGGAAGLAAAAAVLELGGRAVVFERGERLCKKLRITGKGRCNVTNDCSPEEILRNITRNAKFLYSAVYKYPPSAVMAFFEKQGVALKTERGRRVFPVSDKAADIAFALERAVKNGGGKIVHSRVRDIIIEDGKCVGIRDGEGEKRFGAVIIATGGVSYPATGSTGDGHRMAASHGIDVTELRPSLVPVVCRENTAPMMGLSLKNVKLSVCRGDKCVMSEQGEALFCHFGVSGPLVLSASAHMQKGAPTDYRLEFDLKPALDEATLDARLRSDLEKYAAKDFINSLSDLLPSKLISDVVRRTGIAPHKKSGEVSKAERRALLTVLKHYTLTPVGFRGMDEAIITCGGVSVKEVSPSTMMSKKVQGLFFAGEILDVDAYTGGYNLQIAWSTGHLAGVCAAAYVSGADGQA